MPRYSSLVLIPVTSDNYFVRQRTAKGFDLIKLNNVKKLSGRHCLVSGFSELTDIDTDPDDWILINTKLAKNGCLAAARNTGYYVCRLGKTAAMLSGALSDKNIAVQERLFASSAQSKKRSLYDYLNKNIKTLCPPSAVEAGCCNGCWSVLFKSKSGSKDAFGQGNSFAYYDDELGGYTSW